MRNNWTFCSLLAVAIATPGLASADTLRNAGVLGNSGEAGNTLVKFSSASNTGMGVVYDKYGSLWDRGGVGQVNRYALDGRMLATYLLPKDQPNRDTDQIVIIGDKVLVRSGSGLYTVSIDAPSGTAAVPLNVKAELLSPSTFDGWAAAVVNKGDVFLVNVNGEQKPIGPTGMALRGIELGGDGTIYVTDYQKFYKVLPGTPPTVELLGANPGEKPELIDGFWFASVWHSTIRRFDSSLKPAPGVVMGGNSGSFIGHVDEQAEVSNSRGLAKITPELYAASGITGVMHLLQWSEREKRFTPIRRIGAVSSCTALAMDKAGRVFHTQGNWEWNDAPTTPMRNGIPSDEVYGADALDDETVVLYGRRYGQPTVYFGKPAKELRLQTAMPVAAMPKTAVGAALTQLKKRRALLVLQKDGTAQALYIGQDGSFGSDGGAVKLDTATPVKAWTGIAAIGTEKLFAAADGQLIEFARDGDNWKEASRFNAWGEGPAEKLGTAVQMASSGNRLWISDTTRNRVLCLDATTRKVLAQFGVTDEAGTDTNHLTSPGTLTANGAKAVVFDAGNQRLIRLELTP